MEIRQVEVAVIGAGTAGLEARRAAAKADASTLLINAGPWGTTCVRAGCMPSKLLLAAPGRPATPGARVSSGSRRDRSGSTGAR